MRNQFRDRPVIAALTSQAMFPEVLIAIRVIQNSVVKEKCSPNCLRAGGQGLPDDGISYKQIKVRDYQQV